MCESIFEYTRKNYGPWLLAFSLSICLSGLTLAQQSDNQPIKVYLNTSLENIQNPARIRSYRLIIQAFSDLGYTVQFSYLPPKRQVASVREGKADVICLRAEGLEKIQSNTLIIPVVVHHLRTHGYVKQAKAPQSGLWQDMRVETLGLLFGGRLAERYVPKELLQKRIMRTTDRLTSAKMVNAGRLDMMVFPEIIYHAYNSVESETLAGLQKLQPSFGYIDTYCFLNAKQRHLLVPLTSAFNRLKREQPEQFDDSRFPFLISPKEMTNMPSLPAYFH